MRLLDTNIIIGYIRKDVACPPDRFISIVTVGELKAFSIKSKWGTDKQKKLNRYLQTLQVLDIDAKISDIYAEIDAYSQGLHPEKKLTITSRNMGKNDLWIAATAFFFDIPLQTTDNDFDHLSEFGLRLEKTPL
ncbi:PilT protein domain protein [Emticicia oligotrophica DSM 17448]|uniref:PilT protein domain protein n=1 Tax=Emticicia oligotrophica (strain DSM 17448 / CIP 109782 / MTCC 6937 / GPTSA100-15) TaxID=929562 RepID=A0ABM5N4H0_EMTOG|nr:type II toxin-antitoxin system VapC family toxin [Emticicia oligotrophica]AFK04257.1 PilT protein domain protein [Emticicia oligotrophica DSM 17448]